MSDKHMNTDDTEDNLDDTIFDNDAPLFEEETDTPDKDDIDTDEATTNKDSKKPNKKTTKKTTKNLQDITKELIEQIKKTPSELFMTLPIDTEDLDNEEETPDPKQAKEQHKKVIDHITHFQTKPKEIKEYLDRFVVGQNDAKKALAIAVCDHYNFIKETTQTEKPGHYIKQNILMMGPTGVGKTYLVQRIAELIGVPFIKSDATKFTETGYQGGDIEDLVRQLYKKADNNIELTEFGIIYLDEVDKITGSKSTHMKDVSGRGVQSNLLKVMEDTEVPTKPAWDIQSQIKQMMGSNKKDSEEKDTIRTKNILFIMSGAFNQLDEIVKKRLDGSKIGFERALHNADTTNPNALLKHLRTQDLISYGLEPEFAGRLPVRVGLNNLTKEDLYKILTQSEESILEQYITSFKRFNIELAFSECALTEIALLAVEEKIGARSLASILEKTFRPFKFECPSTDIDFIYATKTLIQKPDETLQHYLEHPKEQWLTDIKQTIKDQIGKQNIDAKKIVSACQKKAAKGHIIATIQAAISNHANTKP
jgi:ATP-dependent Clp protease ATP-binding subunit ClpX